MAESKTSVGSLANATKTVSKFSGHNQALGDAGYKDPNHMGGKTGNMSNVGESRSFTLPEKGFDKIKIGAAWDNVSMPDESFFGKMLKRVTHKGVDIDLGCMYALKDGTRGAIQAFGEMWGNYDEAPYIKLSGDERTGDAEGDDEFLLINGKKWNEVERLLIYVYIYEGAPNWALIKPRLHLMMQGEEPMIVVPEVSKTDLPVCAIAELKNIDNGIKLINQTEYFPGHAELDRAYGFGLDWDDGEK